MAADAADHKKGAAAGAAGCVERLHRFAQGEGKRVLKIDRPAGPEVLKFDSLSGRGLWIALSGNAYKVSVTGLAFESVKSFV